MKGSRLVTFWVLTVIAFSCGAAFLWIVWMSDPFTSHLIGYIGATGVVAYGFLVIWMVRDCIRREFPQESTRLNWLVIILLTAPIGTTAYYLMVVRKIVTITWVRITIGPPPMQPLGFARPL